MLEQIDSEIAKVKAEASSRKDILEKVDKWMSACEEESWLEEYNRVRHLISIYSSASIFSFVLTLLASQDDNRYNAGRGAHLTLKRAEKARVLVNKLPGNIPAL